MSIVSGARRVHAMVAAIAGALLSATAQPPQPFKVNMGGHIPYGTNKGGNARAKRAATKARNVKRHRASLKG